MFWICAISRDVGLDRTEILFYKLDKKILAIMKKNMYSCVKKNTRKKWGDYMARIYKTIRFAFETKYWIDQLIRHRCEQLKKNIRENGLADRIENQLYEWNSDELDGVSVNVALNVTVGSIIEQAVRYSRNNEKEDWHKLSLEVEMAKKMIKDNKQDDFTPRLYINEQIYRELEDLQMILREEGARVPRMSFVIKLAVYNLYKSIE